MFATNKTTRVTLLTGFLHSFLRLTKDISFLKYLVIKLFCFYLYCFNGSKYFTLLSISEDWIEKIVDDAYNSVVLVIHSGWLQASVVEVDLFERSPNWSSEILVSSKIPRNSYLGMLFHGLTSTMISCTMLYILQFLAISPCNELEYVTWIVQLK